jgi:hypothetical protein
MKANKSVWLSQVWSTKKKMPSWPCPICNSGVLQKGEIRQMNSEETRKAENNLFYETQALAEFRFVAYLNCTNCEGRVVVAGNGTYFNELNDSPASAMFRGRKYSVFYPKFFEPTLSIIEVPSSVNEVVAELVQKSFTLFWIDLDSCANKIRQALEQIAIDAKAKGENLHRKIESLRKLLGDSLTDTLLAIKYIGNEGSHLGPPFTRDQIVNLYSLLEDVLHQLYPDPNEIARKQNLVNKINTNKGIKTL